MLIFDANDRKKKLKFELKMTDVHFAKNEKIKNQNLNEFWRKTKNCWNLLS